MPSGENAKYSIIAMFLVIWIVAVVAVISMSEDVSEKINVVTGEVVHKTSPGNRFLSVDELPQDRCWENNGCFGMPKGTTYRCGDSGFSNEFGNDICHCNWHCQVE